MFVSISLFEGSDFWQYTENIYLLKKADFLN